MRRGGRSKRSSRQSDRQTMPDRQSSRQTISRPPNYNPRQPINRPLGSFRSLAGDAPTYSRDSLGRSTKFTKTTETKEDEGADD